MNIEEMKLTKFEHIIKAIANQLHCYAYTNLDKKYKSPLEFVITRKPENKFLEIIMSNAYREEIVKVPGFKEKIVSDGKFGFEIKNFHGFVDKIVTLNKYYRIEYIFWLLMIMAVDNENYDENLNLIADTAFMMKIHDHTLIDCIKVVKAVLNGEKLAYIKYYDANVKTCFSNVII